MITSVCPRCAESIRLPAEQLPEDAYATCPWCRESIPLVEILHRLPPMVEIVSADGQVLDFSRRAEQPLATAAGTAALGVGGFGEDPEGDVRLSARDLEAPPLSSGIAPIELEEPGYSGEVDPDAKTVSDETVTDETWHEESFSSESSGEVAFEVQDPREPAADGWEGGGLDSLEQVDAVSPMRVTPQPGLPRRSKGSGLRTVLQVAFGGLIAIPVAGVILWALTQFGVSVNLGFWPFDDQASQGSTDRVAAAVPADAERQPLGPTPNASQAPQPTPSLEPTPSLDLAPSLEATPSLDPGVPTGEFTEPVPALSGVDSGPPEASGEPIPPADMAPDATELRAKPVVNDPPTADPDPPAPAPRTPRRSPIDDIFSATRDVDPNVEASGEGLELPEFPEPEPREPNMSEEVAELSGQPGGSDENPDPGANVNPAEMRTPGDAPENGLREPVEPEPTTDDLFPDPTPIAAEPQPVPESAEVVEAAAGAVSWLEKLQSDDGTDGDRRRGVFIRTYAAIAELAEKVDGEGESVQKVIGLLKASPDLTRELGGATSQWLNFSARPSDGILLMGKPTPSGDAVDIGNGKQIGISNQQALPSAPSVIVLGRIDERPDGKSVRVSYADTLE